MFHESVSGTLSPVAVHKLIKLLGYIEEEWDSNARKRFLNEFENCVALLEQNPKICIKSEKLKGIYKCIISQQTSFYYRVVRDEIQILTVSDNRQNSKVSLEEIKSSIKKLH